jgi:hypothetical protein
MHREQRGYPMFRARVRVRVNFLVKKVDGDLPLDAKKIF